jgi:hypothetical protein
MKFYSICYVYRFRIRKFLGFPDPDPLIRDTDPDLSIIKKNGQKNVLRLKVRLFIREE